MRGEYGGAALGSDASMELPPHARRIRGIDMDLFRTRGTTSACAENTVFHKHLFVYIWNYLRMRGEYRLPRVLRSFGLELPPHARRIPMGFGIGDFFPGTTSACAENTLKHIEHTAQMGNYLRMRGEYSSADPADLTRMELPPHARRIPLALCATGIFLGTTSACAENTPQTAGRSSNPGNYLRMRGEYRGWYR